MNEPSPRPDRELLLKLSQFELDGQKVNLEHIRAMLAKKADVALSIVQTGTRGHVIEGDEWKPGADVDPELLRAANAFLTGFLSPETP